MRYKEKSKISVVYSIDENGIIQTASRSYTDQERDLTGKIFYSIPNQNIKTTFFDKPFKVKNTPQLISAFQQGGTLDQKILDVLYPYEYRLNLLDAYVGQSWHGIDIPDLGDLIAIDTYTIEDMTLFYYSLPVWWTDTIGFEGRRHIVRIMKEDKMLMEIDESGGIGFSQYSVPHLEVNFSLVPGGMLKKTKEYVKHSKTEMWNENVRFDIPTYSGQETEEYIGIDKNGPVSRYSFTRNYLQFGKSAAFSEQLENGNTIDGLLASGILKDDALITSN